MKHYLLILIVCLNSSCLIEIPKKPKEVKELEKENKELRNQLQEAHQTMQWIFYKSEEVRKDKKRLEEYIKWKKYNKSNEQIK